MYILEMHVYIPACFMHSEELVTSEKEILRYELLKRHKW
jgi:hypothetical protein